MDQTNSTKASRMEIKRLLTVRMYSFKPTHTKGIIIENWVGLTPTWSSSLGEDQNKITHQE